MKNENKSIAELKKECVRNIEKLKNKVFFDPITNKHYYFYHELNFYQGNDPDFEGFSYYSTYIKPDIKNIEEKTALIERALTHFKVEEK